METSFVQRHVHLEQNYHEDPIIFYMLRNLNNFSIDVSHILGKRHIRVQYMRVTSNF